MLTERNAIDECNRIKPGLARLDAEREESEYLREA